VSVDKPILETMCFFSGNTTSAIASKHNFVIHLLLKGFIFFVKFSETT
jgi:hypothetical protein